MPFTQNSLQAPLVVYIFFSEDIVTMTREAFVFVNIAFMSYGQGFWFLKYDFFKRYFRKSAKIVITHQIIGLGEKAFDALIILSIIRYGTFTSLIIIIPIYFIYSLFIVMAYDYFLDRGYDLLELENLKANGSSVDGNKVIGWILKRRTTIFLIGSCFQLDPDGVTILLRKSRDDFWGNALRITLPSVIISMTYWTIVFKLGLMGVRFFFEF